MIDTPHIVAVENGSAVRVSVRGGMEAKCIRVMGGSVLGGEDYEVSAVCRRQAKAPMGSPKSYSPSSRKP